MPDRKYERRVGRDLVSVERDIAGAAARDDEFPETMFRRASHQRMFTENLQPAYEQWSGLGG